MLITIYKAFTRSHWDYGDVLYDQTFNNSFKEKLESIQYKALTVTGTSKEKIYRELGLESVRNRRWCRKLFCKVLGNENPKYLFRLIPTKRSL